MARIELPGLLQTEHRRFYENQFRGVEYGFSRAEDHPFHPILQAFVSEQSLGGGRCLEIGCGRGPFQDIVADYVAVDIAFQARKFIRQPFVVASAESLPFQDGAFDAVWSYAVLEQVLSPESAMGEMRRVVKEGGVVLLAAAWQCRPWAAEGYAGRP